MSSIVEGYHIAKSRSPQKVIKTQIEREAELQPMVEVDPAEALLNAAVLELEQSFGERCKRHELDNNKLIIQTGKKDTPGIIVKVEGYAEQTGVVTASQQEDATNKIEELPEDTDQVAAVRKYNTDQYMKHSQLNPKKFG